MDAMLSGRFGDAEFPAQYLEDNGFFDIGARFSAVSP